MYDCHVHSNFSTDGKMEMRQACEAAVRQGLKGIAFTDHLDYDYPGEESFFIDFDKYFPNISSLCEEYSTRLNILKGIEVGIQPHVIRESLNVIESFPFDYVLASVHIVDRMDPYYGDFYNGKTQHEAYRRYLEEIYYMVCNLKSFDMVGHFEYIIRYTDYVDRTLKYDDHREIFDMIFKKLIEQGRGFEVNTGTYRDRRPDARYDIEVLKRYKALGGELICLSSDAHREENIAARFDYFIDFIREAGFEYMVHFENRKPVFEKL